MTTICLFGTALVLSVFSRFLKLPAVAIVFPRSKQLSTVINCVCLFVLACGVYVFLATLLYVKFASPEQNADLYLEGEYYAVGTLTSVGYSVTAHGDGFRKVEILSMLSGGLLWVIGIGLIVGVVQNYILPKSDDSPS